MKKDLSSRAGKTLVLGLGNPILTDDSVGLFTVQEMARINDHSDLVFETASLGGLELLEPIAGYQRLVIVDAVLAQERPGEIIRMRLQDLKGGSAMARHQVPFHEALALAEKLDMPMPKEMLLYGIGVQDILTFGERCTDEVARRIPEIAREILTEIKQTAPKGH